MIIKVATQLKNSNLSKLRPYPFVSIIVPTFNSQNRISETLFSLTSQSYPSNKYEIIVVNDCSTDSTLDVLKEFERVKILQPKSNSGAYFCRDLGLKYSKGQIIFYTDDDCIVPKDWISEHILTYFRNDSAMAVGGPVRSKRYITVSEKYLYQTGYGVPASIGYSKTGSLIKKFIVYLNDMMKGQNIINEKDYAVSAIYTANASYIRKYLIDSGSWNTSIRYGGDAEMSMRLLKMYPGKDIVCNPKAYIYHKYYSRVQQMFRETIIRSPDRYRYYESMNKFPPVFPLPIFFILSLVFLVFFKQYFVFILIPQLLYFWWPIRFVKSNDLSFLTFPYIQLTQEMIHDVCFGIMYLKSFWRSDK